MVEARFLGSFEVAIDDVVVDLGGAKQRTILAILLRAAGSRVSRDALLNGVWGVGSSGAARSLRTNVSNLRRALGMR